MSNSTVYHCPDCGLLLSDDNLITCEECGRPIGGCGGCGWFGLLDNSEPPQECNHGTCEYFNSGPLTEEQKQEMEQLVASLQRQFEADKQIRERSGPIYDRYIEHTRLIGAAWRAAGKPRHVSMSLTKDKDRGYPIPGTDYRAVYYFQRKDHRLEPATEEDWDRWCAWQREKDRIRKEHGWEPKR